MKSFGTIKSGAKAHLYTIAAGSVTAQLTDFGASLVSLTVPSKPDGASLDVVLGYDSAAEYEAGSCYFGAAIGRVGNRIAGGAFTLNGKPYQMDQNENGNCLHGGFSGYDKRIWETESASDAAVTFRLESPDGDQGMPGNLSIRVTYTVSDTADGCALTIRYDASCDRDTLLNPTNHSYFNLNGQGNGDILGHTMQIAAEEFTAVQDGACIPKCNKAVEGTPFDFRKPKVIGLEIDDPDCRQLGYGSGYDHNFVIRQKKGAPQTIAKACGDRTGITMEVISDLPSVQFYAGNLISPQTGKGGAAYGKRSGFCLETQFIPDSINHPEFEPCILRAGEDWTSSTTYLFRR